MQIGIPKNVSKDVRIALQRFAAQLDTYAIPTFAGLNLNSVCPDADGLSFLRVSGLQTDDTALTGILRGAYIDVSNGSTAATGTIRGMELKARTEAPGDSGSNVAVLEGLSISADSKDHSVTTMRAAEFILDGSTGGTITEAVGLRIANNLQANKATTSYGLQIYRDSFDYTADIQLSSGGLIGGSTGHLKIASGGDVTLSENLYVIGTSIPSVTIQSTDASDPKLCLKTTNTTHEVCFTLDENVSDDHVDFKGQTALKNTRFHIIAQSGYAAYMGVQQGSYRGELIMCSVGHLSLKNVISNMNLIFGINDGGVTKTITWDADVNTLLFDDNTILNTGSGNIDTTGTLTATTIGAFQATGAIDFNNQDMTNVDIDSGTITGITDLAIADGGTGQSTAQAAIDALTAVSGATNEHVLTKDTASGNAVWKAAAGGADAFTVKVDVGATADYIGAANNDGVLRTGTSLSYADGGNFVTINAVQDIQTSATPTFAGLIIADGGTVGQAAGPLLTFDDTNNFLEITGCKVGIGLSTPGATVHIAADGVAIPAAFLPSAGTGFILSNEGTVGSRIVVASSAGPGSRGIFAGFRARGTFGTPLVPLEDDLVFSFSGLIYDGVNCELTAEIDFWVDGTVSENVAPQRISFMTGETDAASRVERMVIKADGKIGMGTITVPHGGVGTALLALEGTNASTADGPHIQITTAADDYPLLKIIPYAHDNISLVFDAYTDAGGWKSSDAGSNFAIIKNNDVLIIKYDSGIAAGNALAWNGGFAIDTTGGIFMYNLKSGTDQTNAGAAANELYRDTNDGNVIKIGV